MKTNENRDHMIRITGKHYFACDYVISNVYGDSVFFEEGDAPPPVDTPFMTGEIMEENLKQTLPETPLGSLFTLPEMTREITYLSTGSVRHTVRDGTFIRYGSDEHPMCLHIRADGSVTLSSDVKDLGEMIFEPGQKTYIALQAAAFAEPGTFEQGADDDMHSPLHLGVKTEELQVRFSARGGSVRVRYVIDVNGILAEVTDFTLTAMRLKVADGRRPGNRSAERTSL